MSSLPLAHSLVELPAPGTAPDREEEVVRASAGEPLGVHETEAGAARPEGVAPAPTPAGAAGDVAKRPRRILVAEDNPVNQRVMSRLLARRGFECELAENGREAVEALQSGEFGLVLMDIQMPEMDGLEATRRIREMERGAERRTPIIAVTANVAESDRRRGMEAGMDDYLGKPISPPLLEAAIQRWMA